MEPVASTALLEVFVSDVDIILSFAAAMDHPKDPEGKKALNVLIDKIHEALTEEEEDIILLGFDLADHCQEGALAMFYLLCWQVSIDFAQKAREIRNNFFPEDSGGQPEKQTNPIAHLLACTYCPN